MKSRICFSDETQRSGIGGLRRNGGVDMKTPHLCDIEMEQAHSDVARAFLVGLVTAEF